MKKRTKPTIKYKYKTIKPTGPTTTQVVSQTKQEITELQKQKAQTPKGIKGILQRAAINKQIYERSRTLGTISRTETTKRQTDLAKAQVELQAQKAKLQEGRKSVDFTGILPEQKKKTISLADLY